jgi:hypothetical protein
VVPWRFISDPAGGANWQLLCGLCNRAKSDHFSAAMTQAWLGWPAREGDALLRAGWAQRQAAYAVLSRDRVCALCGEGPSSQRLGVRLRDGDRARGLEIASLEVICDRHGEGDLFKDRAVAQKHLDDEVDTVESTQERADAVVQ